MTAVGDPARGLTRRHLLGAGAAMGALVVTPGLAVAGAPADPPAVGGAAAGGVPGTDLVTEVGLRSLQSALGSGSVTSRDLVNAYLARIAALDRQGSSLHAVLEINPEALAQAEAMDAERRSKGSRGPLHGIPILLKDNIATADGMATTAGSLALLGTRVPRDAALVAALRRAGAILLGKTNLSEWANFRSSHSSSGWSGRGGQCRNPYALDRSPSGSSSGSAAAVAASFAAVAVGTETDGSIVSPSSACALVGIKPTVGLVSRAGVVPISHTQDTAGPMARSVEDAALLLAAMAGEDPADSATHQTAGRFPADPSPLFEAGALRGARIGVARAHFFGDSPATDLVIEAALAAMREAGAVIVDPADLATAGKLGGPEMEVLLFEFKADLNRYLADLGPQAPVHSLAELIAWNEQHTREEMPYFGQELLVRAQAKGALTSASYRRALAKCRRLSRTEGLDATFARHRLDALVAPTSGPAWLIDHINGDGGVGGSSTPAAVAGYPSITVPAGQVGGLPVGISFMGLAFADAKLIRLAFAFEHLTAARRPPSYTASAQDGGKSS
jgi:amidase